MVTDGQLKQRLSERLKQAQAAELAAVEQSTKIELEKLSESLTKVVSEELDTTRNAISQQSSEISSLLSSQTQAIESQTQALDSMKSLTQSEMSEIKRELMGALRKMQSQALSDLQALQTEAVDSLKVSQSKTLQEVHKMQHSLINDSIAPLKASMSQVRKEGEALSKIALRAWLKPLLVSVAVTVGVGVALFLTTGALFQYHTYQLAKLAVLNGEIREAHQTLSQLPRGVRFELENGKKYIFSKKISAPVVYEGEQFVEVE